MCAGLDGSVVGVIRSSVSCVSGVRTIHQRGLYGIILHSRCYRHPTVTHGQLKPSFGGMLTGIFRSVLLIGGHRLSLFAVSSLRNGISSRSSRSIRTTRDVCTGGEGTYRSGVAFGMEDVKVSLVRSIDVANRANRARISGGTECIHAVRRLGGSFGTFYTGYVNSGFRGIDIAALTFTLGRLVRSLFRLFRASTIGIVLCCNGGRMFTSLVSHTLGHCRGVLRRQRGRRGTGCCGTCS